MYICSLSDVETVVLNIISDSELSSNGLYIAALELISTERSQRALLRAVKMLHSLVAANSSLEFTTVANFNFFLEVELSKANKSQAK